MDGQNYTKKWEGLRLKPYKCSAGKITIGYGRNLTDKGISNSEAEILFKQDYADATKMAKFFISDFESLTNIRQNVLIDLFFNMGLKVLQFKKMLKAIKEKDFETASKELLDSKYAQQVGKRAITNAELLRIGKESPL